MGSEYFYGGSTYSLDPKYNLFSKDNQYGHFVGYNVPFGQLSSATDPRTANQIKEVSEHLNTGIKNMEMGAIDPSVFESIPKDHFKEINRLAKLTGAEVTVHAPMIDPTGITDRGWDKMQQKSAEDQLWQAIKQSHDVNPNGPVVTFHATSVGLPGAELMMKEGIDKDKAEKGVLVSEGKAKSFIFVNESDGKIGILKEEKRFFDSEKGNKQVEFNPTVELKRINEDVWMQKVNQLTFYTQRGTDDIERARINEEQLNLQKLNEEKAEGDHPETEEFNKRKEQIKNQLTYGKFYLRDSYRNLKELYDEVYDKVSPEEKKKLEAFNQGVKPYMDPETYQNLEKDPNQMKAFAKKIEEGLKIFGEMRPELYKPIKEFAIEKAAETTANVAWKGYKEFKDKAPIIALENHPAQQSLLTTGEELRSVIEKAHGNFVKKAMSEGMSESDAKEQAKKLIGATWDVGHINMLRRYGFEKQDIVKETEKIAPFVKKVHLSDNFGFEHTELPMGMGNVPMKEIMEKLGKEGYNAKKIIEAGNWWQHFSPGGKTNSPLVPTLQGLGSPMYAGGINWNQVYGGVPGGYFGGYGTMLPDQNFQTYGAGFSSLPTELGGQIANKDSRFSGTPMS